MSYTTAVIPSQTAQAFTPDMIKALSLTGQVVTVRVDGDTYQGKIVTVEGDTWTTLASGDVIILDTDCTRLPHHEDAHVHYEWSTPWGQTLPAWAKLSQVSRGVSLAKCAK